jgi:flavorubredoxin
LKLLGGKRIGNRVVGLFGSHGWAGGAIKAMQEFVADASFDLVEPVVDARFAATSEQLDQCRKLGRAMATRVSQKNE